MAYRSQVKMFSRRRRATRRRLALRAALAGAAALVSAATFIALLSRSDFLAITRIDVAGNRAVSSQAVLPIVTRLLAESDSGFISRNNVFLYPRSDIEAALLHAIPPLASVAVKETAFGRLTVLLSERVPAALWCSEGGEGARCYLLDETSMIFAEATTIDSPLIRFRGRLLGANGPIGERYLSEDSFSRLRAFLGALRDMRFAVTEVAAKENSEAEAVAAAGTHIFWSLLSDPAVLRENLSAALRSEKLLSETGVPRRDIEYLDLRFSNKVLYRIRR